jgi:hypothetical protein
VLNRSKVAASRVGEHPANREPPHAQCVHQTKPLRDADDAARRQIQAHRQTGSKADYIAEGYEQRGVAEEEAERRAWATVNKESGGGNKSGLGSRRPG